MLISFIFFILIHVFALVYFMEVIRRVRHRAKEYSLKDSTRTLPFGFVRLRYIIILYVVVYVVWIALSFLLYFGWYGGGAFFSPPAPGETLLNL
ncbi:hypothetical protein COY07_05895 [Candidatus Peregrinibacteria bacterium CG_4_10_14_0_2_um_filter_43_11]|nr:MAG: hypothetical protein COY07_05895 [Candidatus Peregrinibacteria bacterium CG_4_10_14_0_2_um_filter_43_11]